MDYDLAIVGSGGAAFAAAIAARRANASVVMVERADIGGTCVNTGCVPSKALLGAAEARHVALSADRFAGLHSATLGLALPELIAGKDKLVESMRNAKYADLADEYGWRIIGGTARFVDGPALEVTTHDGATAELTAAHYVVATGAAAWAPPIPGLSAAGYLTSTTAMQLPTLPKSMIVMGGNAIGLEQAQLFSRLGVAVTLVEVLDRLAPFGEPEASQAIAGVFADEGIKVHTGAEVIQVTREGTVVAVHMSPGHTLRADHLLVATGRRPVTDGLGLDCVGVKLGAKGEVMVDDQLRTDNPRIFAAGDVTGHPQFVYVAANHGTIAAANALSQAGQSVDYRYLPQVTFTSPAMASVGLTHAQAKQQGFRADSRVLTLQHVPRAVINRDTRGMVKLVIDSATGRLLGVHAVAEGAGELAAAAVYALAAAMTVDQVAGMWCPYLTMAEAIKLTAQTFTRDVSKLSCCAA
ncbi:mercuric reductase MerA [Rhizocola hellebori]|uniref:Mercuric reductase n=1 Tax=Rhizocola hellebori TaxID=1392758 RepID=A0A8J3Q4W0_9ACTN|nr:mercury(II) reductase [Rhizocola hellebori]GIH03484.1 mercuric reductase MerA [Rhizocola hellebori]